MPKLCVRVCVYSDIMKLYLGEPGKRCLGIINTGPDGFLIIGDVVMENYYIVYDVGNSRVGWAAVNKDNCGSI